MGKKNKLNVPAKEMANIASETKEDESQLLEEQVDRNLESVSQVYEGDEEDTSTSAYLWLLVFSFLMFTFPFLTFYGVHSWLDESFEFSTFQTNCFSVLASVIVVNVIICLYVYKAFCEGSISTSKPAAINANAGEEDKKDN